MVATAGTTNLGLIDDLAGVAEVCRERGLWLHVDGAYGLAALCAPSARDRFAGIEHADSFIVDPHKWLFSPFDCCALVYRDPALGRAAHRQHASYLEALYVDDDAFNPSDYGVHLTRRARGLPFWFALAVHGTDAFAEAVETTLALTRAAAEEIARRDELELVVEPELSVLVFRRRGWARGGLRALGRQPARVRHRVRDPDDGRRRDRRQARTGEPADDARRRQDRARRNGGVSRTLGRWSTSFQDLGRMVDPAVMTPPPLTSIRATALRRSCRRSVTRTRVSANWFGRA